MTTLPEIMPEIDTAAPVLSATANGVVAASETEAIPNLASEPEASAGPASELDTTLAAEGETETTTPRRQRERDRRGRGPRADRPA